MSLRGLALLLGLTLLTAGLAHGPGIEVTGARSVNTPEGTFLELRIDAPDVDDPHALIAVSTRYGSGEFERVRANAYRPVDAVPILAGTQRYGAATDYRVRLPHPPEGVDETPLTVMFSAGELVHVRMVVVPPAGGDAWSARIWMPISIVLAGAGFAMVLPALLGRRSSAS